MEVLRQKMSILEDIYFILLYGGVTMLNVVAALYLLFRRANAIAPDVASPVRLRIWAAVFLICAAASHVLWMLYACHPSPVRYVLICGLDILFFIPAIAGILLTMLQDRRRPIWPVVAMVIPPVLVSSLSILSGNDALIVPLSIYIIALYALFMLYMFFAVRRYGRWLKDNYADLEHKEIWQSLLILAVFMLFFLLYSSATDIPVILYLLQIDNVIIVGLLLWRVETLQQLQETTPVSANPTPSASSTVPGNLGPLLEMHCAQARLYLQHDLTLSQLAQTIGTNRSYLSQHFSQQGLTYNAYINGLRVNHFIGLYRQAIASHRIFTAQQLASESGFHSYSTFSAAFKQKTGMTVTEWMRNPKA